MKRIAFVLLCFALLIASFASAQETTLGLSAADALLLAAANHTPLDSFAFDYTAHFSDDLDTFAAAADLSGSGAVDRSAPALAASISGQLTLGSAQTISLDSEIRWIDNALHLKTPGGWQALDDLSGAVADRISDFTGLAVDREALTVWNLMGVDGLDDLLTTLLSADLASFATAERLADKSVGDAQTAHFQVGVDLHALFASDAFVDGIVALSQAQGSDLIIRTRDEVADMLRANDRAVDPATLTIDEYVGLEDHLLHRIAVSLEMQVAPQEAGYASAPFAVTASFDATLSDHNQPQTIIAPDDAAAVSEFTMPMPAPEPPGEGVTQYVFFGALDENAVDSYPIEAQAGDTVSVTARRLSLAFDPLITLLSPGGEALAENDDHEAAIFGAADYDAQIADFSIPESGTYSIEITDSFGGAGSYLLTITIQG